MLMLIMMMMMMMMMMVMDDDDESLNKLNFPLHNCPLMFHKQQSNTP
jgi:hypothetical protein